MSMWHSSTYLVQLLIHSSQHYDSITELVPPLNPLVLLREPLVVETDRNVTSRTQQQANSTPRGLVGLEHIERDLGNTSGRGTGPGTRAWISWSPACWRAGTSQASAPPVCLPPWCFDARDCDYDCSAYNEYLISFL